MEGVVRIDWKRCVLHLCLVCLFSRSEAQRIQITNTDPRAIENGYALPSEHYADQPYVIVCDDGSWLCTMTTSSGTEYAYMNHIVSTKSYDQGKTWTRLKDVEPGGIPQSSWAVPLKVPGGRIYVFYNYNANEHKGLSGVMSGPFMFKYSDDHGKSWSEKRYEVPIRNVKIDYDNFSKGECQFFWCIDKPVVTDDAAYITYSKLLFDNPEGKGFYKRSEGFILKSENILTAESADEIVWELLPDGEVGINNADLGQVQAEHNMEILSNGDLYVVYRTQMGYPAYSISRNGGKSFSLPKPLSYATGGYMGNPRACPKIHRTKDGKYLLWYHNNFRNHTYQGRNPVWISGGVEKDGEILWSQPEILIYDLDPEAFGMSYPDFIEQDGKMWVIETQKSVARVHPVNLDLLDGLWSQSDRAAVAREGLVLELSEEQLDEKSFPFPSLPSLMQGGGASVEMWLTTEALKEGTQIFSTFGPKHKGMEVLLTANKSISIRIHDGEMRDADGPYLKGQTFTSDEEMLSENTLHHVVFVLDGASKIASILIDGVLSDGEPNGRAYGWGRIHTFMKDLNDTYTCKMNQDFNGELKLVRVYDRYLTNAEAISNYRAGM